MDLNIGNIGVWGAGVRWTPLPNAEALTEPAGETRHYEFLKQNRPSTVGVMRLNNTLENYLKDVNQQATVMLETLVRQYAKAEGATKALKRANQLGWMQKMNLIHNRAEEVILNEIIYR